MATRTSPPTYAPTYTPTYTPTYATPSITTTTVPTPTETTSTTTPYTTTTTTSTSTSTSIETHTTTTLHTTSTSYLPPTTSPPTSDSTTKTSSPPYGSTTAVTSIAAPTETFRTNDGPISIGGIVGIVVAAVVACIALGILAIALYRQRRRRRLDRNSNIAFNPESTDMRENRRPGGPGNDGTGLGIAGNGYQSPDGHTGMSQDPLNTSTLGASGFSGRSGEVGYGGNRLNTAAGGMNNYMDDGNWQQQRQPQYDPGYAARQEQNAAYMQYQQRMQEQQAAADAAAGYYGSQHLYPEPQNEYYTNQIYSHDDGRHLYQGTHGYDVGSGQAYNDNTHVTGTQASPHMNMDPSQHQLYNNSAYGGAIFPEPTDAPTNQYIYPESDTRYTRTGPVIPDSATRLDAAQSGGQQGIPMGPESGNPKTANSPQRIPSARRGPQALYQESEPATR